jgi:hypothetical protein
MEVVLEQGAEANIWTQHNKVTGFRESCLMNSLIISTQYY